MLKQQKAFFIFVGLVLLLNSSVLVARQYICVENDTNYNLSTFINGHIPQGSLPNGVEISPAKTGESNTVVIYVCKREQYPYCRESNSNFIKKFGYANSPGDVYFKLTGNDKESLKVIAVNKPCRPEA